MRVILAVEHRREPHTPSPLPGTMPAPGPEHLRRRKPPEGGDEFGTDELREGHRENSQSFLTANAHQFTSEARTQGS
jgi:hypothetical protein